MPTTTTGIATEFINFTRASNATVTDSNGVIKWAPHNLLLASEQFDASNWTKASITVTANYAAAPNGTTTADRAVYVGGLGTPATRQLTQSVAISTSELKTTFGIWVSGTGKFRIQNVHGAVLANYSSDITATATPTLYTITVTNAANAGNGFQVGGICAATTDDAFDLNIWGAHLYRSDLGGMQANTSAYPMYNPTTPKNLLGYTEDFSNAYWQKAGIAAFGSGSVANASVAPNGLQTADLITTDTSNGYHVVYGTAVSLAGGVAMHSWYVKPNGYTKIAIRENGASGYYGTFNLSGAGSVLDSTATYVTAAVTSLSDGWYRISARITNATSQQAALWILPDSYTSGTPVFMWTANGTSGIYLWGAQLSDSASLDPYAPNHFTAPSAAAYYGPRRDFDPVTLACKGLLVEEQRTNVILQSADFSTTWAKTGTVTITADYATAPDGTLTADRFVSTGGSFPQVAQTRTLTAGQPYTFSVWVKSDGTTQIAQTIIIEGTVTSFTPTSTWTRVSSTVASSAGGSIAAVIATSSATAAASSFLLWGAQLELGSFATSYIPTTTATATRSADEAKVSTAAFPYSATEGTLVARGVLSIGGRYVGLYDTTSKQIEISQSNATTVNGFVYTSGSTQATLNATANAFATNKAAIAFKENDVAVCANGGTVAVDTPPASIPVLTSMTLNSYAGSVLGSGWIQQITYLPRRISNTELQTRTA